MTANIGDLLKNKRLEIRADINDISNEIHIKVDYLKAIESQDFELYSIQNSGSWFCKYVY